MGEPVPVFTHELLEGVVERCSVKKLLFKKNLLKLLFQNSYQRRI